MPLESVTVEKTSVNTVMSGQWTVTFTLRGFDQPAGAGNELFAQDFSEDYKSGDPISRVQAGFIEKMQQYIDDYQQEETYMAHAQMDNSVTTVQAGLTVA